MDNNSSELVKILKTAIEVESNGLITYLEFARKTRDVSGKDMFVRLSMDEHEHRMILENVLHKLLDGEALGIIKIPVSEIEKVAPKIREKQYKTRGEGGLAETEALEIALDLEKKAAEFFSEKSKEVGNPEAKAMFLRLAEWENVHYDILQAELDSINKTGFWFDIPEFRLDGKF